MASLDSCRFESGPRAALSGIYFLKWRFKICTSRLKTQRTEILAHPKITGIVTSLFFLEAAVPLYFIRNVHKGSE